MDKKIRTDAKDNDIRSRVDQISERIQKIWEAISQIKLDWTRIKKKTTPHLDDRNGNFRVRTAVVSVDENQKKITDLFSHVTKDKSVDSLARSHARRSELEKLEKLELPKKMLKEMESTETRLIQENQQLRAEKEQKSRKSEKKISKSNINNKQNIEPNKKCNTGSTPSINKEESGEKQSETVKKGKN